MMKIWCPTGPFQEVYSRVSQTHKKTPPEDVVSRREARGVSFFGAAVRLDSAARGRALERCEPLARETSHAAP